MNFSKELTYSEMIETLEKLQNEYPFIKLEYIGKSENKRKIPVVTLGDSEAEKSVLYVSTHHALENICTSVLVGFIEEYAVTYESHRQIFGINLHYLNKMRKIYVIPMLNPDGVEYRLCGVSDDDTKKNYLRELNQGMEDFSFWNSNANGVDLNHNYDAYFDAYKEIEKENGIFANSRGKYSGNSPESESEIKSLCDFIRSKKDIEAVITLHTQGEEIYCKSGDFTVPKAEFVAGIISKMSGYKISKAEGTASYGGLTDWFIKEFSKPSFTLECGMGQNPLPVLQLFEIYSKIRETLFKFPVFF